MEVSTSLYYFRCCSSLKYYSVFNSFDSAGSKNEKASGRTEKLFKEIHLQEEKKKCMTVYYMMDSYIKSLFVVVASDRQTSHTLKVLLMKKFQECFRINKAKQFFLIQKLKQFVMSCYLVWYKFKNTKVLGGFSKVQEFNEFQEKQETWRFLLQLKPAPKQYHNITYINCI